MRKISLLFCVLCACMMAHAETINGITYSLYSSGDQFTAEVVALDEDPYEYRGDIVIPSTVDYDGVTYTVTRIGYQAFKEDSVTSIVLPNTIKELAGSAFAYCYYLASINLPEGLEIIDSDAFWWCRSLTSLTLPSTLKEVGYYAFEYCLGLKTITIPNSVEKMGGWICLGDTLEAPVYNNKFFVNLPYGYAENYTIPDGIEVICEAACYENHHLKSVTIPASVKTIENYAFDECDSLTSVTLSEGLEVINDRAFANTAITSLALPASLTSLSASALPATLETLTLAEGSEYFYMSGGCLIKKDDNSLVFALKGATLPEGIVEIGNYAFQNRSDLTEFVVPSTVKTIGHYAFDGCDNLTSITLPEGLTTIGNYAFQYCKNLKSVTLPSTITNLRYADGLFYKCHRLESVTILCEVDYLPQAFFLYCDSLKSFTLPESVKDYGYNAFRDAGFTSPVHNSHLFARMPQGYKGAYTIPDGITKVGRYAFYMCDSLTEISFPASVHKIDNEAFWGCYSLTRIAVPEGVDSIDSYAFEDCHNVETLILPSTLTYIEGCAFAFYDESKLKEVYNYAVTPYEFEAWDDPFTGVPNVDQIKLYVPDESVEAYKAALIWKDFDVQPMAETPTGLEESSSLQGGDRGRLTNKVIRNGQLLIEKNGKIYNVVGQQLR